MPHIIQPKIFAANLDDEAFRVLGRDVTEPALLAYVLLGESIILHPAYEFQNPDVDRLVFGPGGHLIAPPLFQIVLGDSRSVGEYMPNRAEKLTVTARTLGVQLPELQQYRTFGSDDLRKKSDALDDRFTAERGVFQVSEAVR